MSVLIREFRRSDRDQLTNLINLHVCAVLPGVSLYADAGSLPAPACYGVPNSWPHIRSSLDLCWLHGRELRL